MSGTFLFSQLGVSSGDTSPWWFVTVHASGNLFIDYRVSASSLAGGGLSYASGAYNVIYGSGGAVPFTAVGASGGLATLNASGRLPVAQLPNPADLPTSLPGTSGQYWLNGGVLCVS